MTISLAHSAQPDIPSGRIAALVYFWINGAMFGTWASRIPAIKARFDLTEAMLGLILLYMAVGAVAAFFVTGRLSDTKGASRVTAIAGIGMAATLPLMAWMPSPVLLGVALFLFGALGGSLDLAMNAYGAEVEARRGRSTMSMLHGFWSVGFGMAAGIGALAIALDLTPEHHFALMCGVGLCAAVFAQARLVPSLPQPRAVGAQFVWPTGPVLAVGLFAGFAFVAEGSLLDWVAVFLIETHLATPERGALALALFSVVMVVMRLSGDHLITRVGPRRALMLSTLLAGLGMAGVGLSPVWWSVFAAIVPLAAGLALIAPLAFSRAGRAPEAGRAVAAVAICGYGGLLFGPVIMGFLGEIAGLGTAFVALAALTLPLIALVRRATS
ncbi:MFS family permease [Rubricella aquisinus]|uniref:MFS family permease n=1 Tax=Rubricella aquisinus TaxID=2028108 RepID=A0A840WRH5_9RHOB|nr:MFS transporter [Rubricella aquisinus]MBB5516272.1 MFS family permease [Rubricella aquisinus]